MYNINNLPEILSIRIENILPDKLKNKQVINFSKYKLGIIYGEAGSGKTTIINAILIGLFGSKWVQKMNREVYFTEIQNSEKPPLILLRIKIKDEVCLLKRNLNNFTITELKIGENQLPEGDINIIYQNWLEKNCTLTISQICDVYDILFYSEEGTQIKRTLWDVERQSKMFSILINNRDYLELLKEYESKIQEIISIKARLRNTKSSLKQQSNYLKKEVGIAEKDVPSILELINQTELDAKTSEATTQIKNLKEEMDEIEEIKTKQQKLLRNSTRLLENLKKEFFDKETKIARKVFPPRDFLAVISESLKHNFCLVCEQSPESDEWEVKLNAGECIVCGEKLSDNKKEFRVLDENMSDLQNEIILKTEEINEISAQLREKNRMLRRLDEKINEVILSIPKEKIFKKDEENDSNQQNLNLVSLSVIMQQIREVEEETNQLKNNEVIFREKIVNLQKTEFKRIKQQVSKIEKLFEKICKENIFGGWSISYKQFPINDRKYPIFGFEPNYRGRKRIQVSDSENAFLDLIFRLTIIFSLKSFLDTRGTFLIETFDRYVDDMHLKLVNNIIKDTSEITRIILTANRIQSPFIRNLLNLGNSKIVPISENAAKEIKNSDYL